MDPPEVLQQMEEEEDWTNLSREPSGSSFFHRLTPTTFIDIYSKCQEIQEISTYSKTLATAAPWTLKI
jgi:hypothetical protein